MTYYVVVDKTDNSFVKISSSQMLYNSDQNELVFEGELPGITEFNWNKELLCFEKKPSRVISKDDFELRFTQDELSKIRFLANNNMAALVCINLFDAAKTIDLDYAGIYYAIEWLVNDGTLTPGRTQEILI